VELVIKLTGPHYPNDPQGKIALTEFRDEEGETEIFTMHEMTIYPREFC
jgi:hypothetical protein